MRATHLFALLLQPIQHIFRCGLPSKKTALLWVLLASAIGLAGCRDAPPPSIETDPSLARITDPKARRALQRGDALGAANIYSRLAEQTRDAEKREDYQLVSAEILFDRGLLESAVEKLAAVPGTLSTIELQQRRQILQARAAYLNSQPAAAIGNLPDPLNVQSSLHRARIYEIRALAYRALQDPDNELIARIDLESELAQDKTIDRNHEQIWNLLTTQPLTTLRGLTTNVRDDTYQGWIELALANAGSGVDENRRAAALSNWQTRFPDHPAAERWITSLLTPNTYQSAGLNGGNIEQIAVLLPLSAERAATVSNAIRDGLIAAWQRDANRPGAPTLRFYDIGADTNYVRSAYQTAITNGADAIIGPLRKSAVSAIVTQRSIPVPTITLNTVDAPRADGQQNLIQFGLSPEDEARAGASRAVALKYQNAVIFQADDSRGDREARAFQEAMFQFGGDVVHVAVLPEDEYDYSEQIRDALQISASDRRFRTLSSVIDQKLFFEPSIRNDVDVIFLAISSEQARSVRPQLDFFYAREIPRFGTSRVAGVADNPTVNKDLNTYTANSTHWASTPIV